MDNLTCSTAQLIDILGVSRKTIITYVQEGMPKLGYGRFRLPDAVQWLLARLKANKAKPTLDEARKKLYQAQTEKLT